MSSATETLTRTQIKTPSMWSVVFHNDDFTPFEFVIAILMRFFNKTEEQAADIAQRVHEQGKAKVGSYTKEIALTKVTQVTDTATKNNHPLKVTPEEA